MPKQLWISTLMKRLKWETSLAFEVVISINLNTHKTENMVTEGKRSTDRSLKLAAHLRMWEGKPRRPRFTPIGSSEQDGLILRTGKDVEGRGSWAAGQTEHLQAGPSGEHVRRLSHQWGRAWVHFYPRHTPMCGTHPESLLHRATDRREQEASPQKPAVWTGKQKPSNFPLKGNAQTNLDRYALRQTRQRWEETSHTYSNTGRF